MTVDGGTLRIEHVPWTSLTPDQSNPRNGDVDGIRESVQAHGVFRPIICADDLTILAGHHLYQALGELGHRDVPVIRLPVPAGSPEARKIMLVDNRLSDRAMYDTGLLLGLLDELDASEGLIGTGYSVSDLDDLRALMDDGPLDLGDGVPDRPSGGTRGRTIMLEFDRETFDMVRQQLNRLRVSLGVDSDSEVVRMLVGRAVRGGE